MKLCEILVGLSLIVFSSESPAEISSRKEVARGLLIEKTFKVTASECFKSLLRTSEWDLACQVVVKNSTSENEILVQAETKSSFFPATGLGAVRVTLNSAVDGYSLRFQSAYPATDSQVRELLEQFIKDNSIVITLSLIKD